MAEPYGVAYKTGSAIVRVLTRWTLKYLPLRLDVAEECLPHGAGSFSLELVIDNGRADAPFRAQVTKSIGTQPGLLGAPWHPQWWNSDTEDHEIAKGESGRLWVVETHGRDSGDPVPRYLDFRTPTQRFRTYLADLPGDPETLDAPHFMDRPVVLNLIVTNRGLRRSRRYKLRFWVTHDLELGHEFVRLRRWPRSPRF